MSSPLAVVVTADISGLTRGMQDAASVARSGGSEVSSAFASVRQSAANAEGALAGFAREQRSQDRMLGWYAGQLTTVAGATGQFKEAVVGASGVLMDLASGSVIGAAVGAVGLLALAWHEFGDESGKANDKVTAKVLSLTDLIDKQAEALRKRNFLLSGGGENEYEAKQAADKELGEKRPKLLKEIQDREAALADAQAHYTRQGVANNGAIQESLANRRAEIQKLKDELTGLEKFAQYAQDRAATLDGKTTGIEKFKGMGQSATAFITSDEVEAADKSARAAGERYKKTLEEVLKANAKGRTAWGLSQYGGYGTDGDAGRRQGAMAAGDQSEMEANLTKYAGGVADRGMKGGMGNAGMSQSGIDKAIDQQNSKVKGLQDSYKKLGDIGGKALEDIASKHKDVGEVARDVAKQVGMMLAKMALQAITNAALKGGAEAAASSAQAGPPGVIAAPGVMAAFIGMVMGLLGSVVSAEGGADFGALSGAMDSRGGMLGVWHPNEIMLPAGIANYVRKAAQRDSEAMSGERTSTTLTVVGKRGTFYDMAIEGGRDFGRAIRDLQRKGVL